MGQAITHVCLFPSHSSSPHNTCIKLYNANTPSQRPRSPEKTECSGENRQCPTQGRDTADQRLRACSLQEQSVSQSVTMARPFPPLRILACPRSVPSSEWEMVSREPWVSQHLVMTGFSRVRRCLKQGRAGFSTVSHASAACHSSKSQVPYRYCFVL